jgi:hypothetical protein
MNPVRVIAHVIAAFLIALLAQSASESRPSNDPKAVELFRKAAAAQVEGGRAIPIRDFQADLEVTIHETDEKTKERSRHSASVSQFYRDRGDKRPLFRRHLTDKLRGTTTIQAYDGANFWQQLGSTPARDLKGRESKDERDRITTEMSRTREYLWFLFLGNLDGKDVTFRYVGPRTVKANGIDRAVEAIVREKPGEGPIELYIGESEGRTVLFGLSRKNQAGKTELVLFSVHRVVKSGGATALVPLVAEYKEDGVLTFEARAARETDLKFNTGLTDQLFALPR